MKRELNSYQIIEKLRELDENDQVELTPWECDFFESVFTQEYPLSKKQRRKALQIIEERTPPEGP